MRGVSKIPFFILFLIVVLVVANRFYQYYINKNFTLDVNAPCDVNTEACFAPTCEGDELGCEAKPYKKVEIIASSAPRCLEEHSCADFTCDGIDECSVTYCSDDTIDDGESCVVPETDTTVQAEESTSSAITTE